MVINEKDRPTYDALRMEIIEERAPSTALQLIACEEIVNCTWRVRNLSLLETKQLQSLLVENQVAKKSTNEGALPAWYGSDRTLLHNFERLLLQLYDEAKGNAGMHLDRYKDALSAYSGGPEFYKILTDWAPRSPDTILLAEHLYRHAHTFKGHPLPPNLVPPADKDAIKNINRRSWDMLLKVIELQIQHVHSLAQLGQGENGGGPVPQQGAGLDSISRYAGAVRRDLDRAIERYLRIKETGL